MGKGRKRRPGQAPGSTSDEIVPTPEAAQLPEAPESQTTETQSLETKAPGTTSPEALTTDTTETTEPPETGEVGGVPPGAPAPVLGTSLDDGADPDLAAPEVRQPETAPVAVEGRGAWRRLLRMSRPRATRANALGALLALLLGVGIAAQVQLTNQRGLDELSQTDLVRVLDDITLRSSRLDQQVRELEATRDRLKSGTGTAAEALDQAQKRVDTLGILAGTLAAKGPGITMRVTDPTNAINGPIVLDLIQELRDAGAESIDVGGARVVASSFVSDRNGAILIDGQTVPRPIVIKAIGDSKTLSSAMTIPGGIVESVRQKGAEATVTESSLVEITSLHRPTPMTHAKPTE